MLLVGKCSPPLQNSFLFMHSTLRDNFQQGNPTVWESACASTDLSSNDLH
jgi:hypothetical protein